MAAGSDDTVILDAARAIRPYLADLVGLEEAESVDAELAELLAQAVAGRNVDDAILGALSADAVLRDWTAAFLQTRRPPVADRGVRSYEPLAGAAPPTHPTVFACPYGDYVWYERSPRALIPACPTHRCVLELVDEPLE